MSSLKDGSSELDDFVKLRGLGGSGFRSMNLWRQDKGQEACARAFVSSIQGGAAPIPVEELFEVSRLTGKAAETLR